MLQQIYFIDDMIDESLSKVMRDVLEPLQGKVVTMDGGITRALDRIDELNADEENRYGIIVNNPLLVDYIKDIAEISWNNIFGFDFTKHVLIPITELTNKDLRPSNNFTKLWMGGMFCETENPKYLF